MVFKIHKYFIILIESCFRILSPFPLDFLLKKRVGGEEKNISFMTGCVQNSGIMFYKNLFDKAQIQSGQYLTQFSNSFSM